MKLTVSLKLKTTPEDDAALLATLERANTAANAASDVAWQTRTFGQFALQKVCYQDIRDHFDLTAQVVIRLLSKVADAYKLDRQRKRVFRRHGSIAYDDRILRYGETRVSIWTVAGRRSLPFVCDRRTRRLLPHRHGESDLVYRDGTFYLFATVDYEAPPEGEAEEALGVDLGVVNIAVDSDGNRHSSRHFNSLRHRHAGAEIVRAAGASGADLILLGVSARPGRRLFLGETVAHVLRHARCTVALFRP